MRRSVLLAVLLFTFCMVSMATAVDYKIKSGDTLGITVLDEVDLTRRVVVDPQGNISLPLINEISVAGSSIAQATDEITTRLRKFIKNPQVSIELVNSANMQVTVTGDVRTPGVYGISSGARIMDAITTAGGYNPTADMSKVTVTTSGGNPVAVDMNRFLLNADASVNLSVSPGDTVFVPTKDTQIIGTVSVLGAVRQSGQHQVIRGMTVREAIMLAGGPTEFADLDNITLRRSGAQDAVAINYMAATSGSTEDNLELKPGDVIYVGVQRQLGFFSINGAVNNPGRYELKGDTSLTEAIAIAGGVKDRAKLSGVRILRTSSGANQTLQANVGDIYAGKAQNVPIQDQDTIWIGQKSQKPDLLRIISLGLSIGWLLTK